MATFQRIQKLVRSLGLLAMFVALLPACSQQQVSKAPPAAKQSNIIGEYVIGVGDQLYIDVWKIPEITMGVPVRPDGNISLPLVGDIPAQGTTATELAKLITKDLEKYLRSPQVTVIVTNAVSVDYLLRVRVTGAVERPISIPHKDGMTVLDLVLEAGGTSPYAAPNKAKLYRKVGEEVKVYAVRLGDILNKGKLDTNYTLYPSDIVTIPERLL